MGDVGNYFPHLTGRETEYMRETPNRGIACYSATLTGRTIFYSIVHRPSAAHKCGYDIGRKGSIDLITTREWYETFPHTPVEHPHGYYTRVCLACGNT